MRFRLLSLLALALTLAALLAAHPAEAGPPAQLTPLDCPQDLSGETLRFYYFGDLSGPYTFLTAPVVAGFSDALAYFNTQGGICGAEIAASSQRPFRRRL